MWDEVLHTWIAAGTDIQTFWKGRQILKSPLDLWVAQEIIWETKPDVLIETGSKWGGSAYFYGDLGVEVHSIDLAPPKTPHPHPNVTYYTGYSVSGRNLAMIGQAVSGRRTMVVLDSDHHKANVLAELEAFAPFVSQGCYLICEDTHASGTYAEFVDDGPAEALAEWLPDHPEFRPDRTREKWGVTMHRGGWLLRI